MNSIVPRLVLIYILICLIDLIRLDGADQVPQKRQSNVLHSRVAQVVRDPGNLELLRTLSSEEVSQLVERFKNTPLRKRWNLIGALAYIGSDQTLTALTNSVATEFRGKVLRCDEDEPYLLLTLEAIGIHARKNDRAMEFLKACTDTNICTQLKRWRCTDKDCDRTMSYKMVGFATKGLGLSGRAEVPSILEKLRERPLDFLRSSGVGSIVDAAFLYESQAKGGDQYIRSVLRHEERSEDFRRWTETENGQRWTRWYNGIMGIGDKASKK